MKLISKFHDYYDSVAYSDEPIFIRKMEIVGHANVSGDLVDKSLILMDDFHTMSYFRNEGIGTIIERIVSDILCFCGKMYPIMKIGDQYICDPYKLQKYCDEKGYKISKYFWPINKRNKSDAIEQIITDIVKTNNGDNLAYNLNVVLNSPIVTISKCKNLKYPTDRRQYIQYEINSKLELLNFQTIKTPWQTYQEIEIFLGTILVENQDKPAIMNDELKRDSKGFNEWSFKQVGPKKRKRRKK